MSKRRRDRSRDALAVYIPCVRFPRPTSSFLSLYSRDSLSNIPFVPLDQYLPFSISKHHRIYFHNSLSEQRGRRVHPYIHSLLTMSFLSRGEVAKSPAIFLMEGLFPNISRYLSGRSRHVSDRGVKGFLCLNAECSPQVGKQGTEQIFKPVSIHKHSKVAAATRDPRIEQESLTRGSTANLLPGTSSAEQLVAPQYISPHPLVTFAQVPTIYEIQSSPVVAKPALDPEQPLSSKGDMSSSPQSLERATEAPSLNKSDIAPAQGLKPQVLAETPPQVLRPVSSSRFGMC